MVTKGDAGNGPEKPEIDKADLLTVVQVAAILNYSRQWVEDAIIDGRIQATRVGGQNRIAREEVERIKREGAKKVENHKAGLLTVRQVAAILNYSRGWVEEAILDGRIKATRVGGQYRVNPDEVKRIMESGVSAAKNKKKAPLSPDPVKPPAAVVPGNPIPIASPPAAPSPAAAPPAAAPVPAPASPAPPNEVKTEPPKSPEKPKSKGFDLFEIFR